jgi:RNA polymerase-interacting CarD/CdnL/TRCF family regulator
MPFKIGDQVVHPHHGVGTITNLANKQFEPGNPRGYYEISILDGTLWVPLDESSLGLRALARKGDLDQCGEILQGAPSASGLDPRKFREALARHLREGTILAQCEVVRDVTALGWKKPLMGAMADLRRVALNVLCQEWAAVADVPLGEATQRINAYLSIGKRAYRG